MHVEWVGGQEYKTNGYRRNTVKIRKIEMESELSMFHSVSPFRFLLSSALATKINCDDTWLLDPYLKWWLHIEETCIVTTSKKGLTKNSVAKFWHCVTWNIMRLYYSKHIMSVECKVNELFSRKFQPNHFLHYMFYNLWTDGQVIKQL